MAVVPFHEEDLLFAAELIGLLGLPWNEPEVLRRLRDKAAQTEFLVTSNSGVRASPGRRVTRVGDLFECELPRRFVRKPTDGAGNVGIGIFDRGEAAAAERHLRSLPDREWVLEEFVAGPEFNVNGQVRPDSEVVILTIFEARRRELNGCSTVYDSAAQLASTHVAFASIVTYTQQLLQATGLRGSPFHLELIVDEFGPCMIDLAARFGGSDHADLMARSHPGRPDPFAVAVHDVLGPNEFACDAVDWDEHDLHHSMVIYGQSTETTSIRSIEGCGAVERYLVPTRELADAPYVVTCSLGPMTDPAELAEHVRRPRRDEV